MSVQLTVPAPAQWINVNERPHWREKARRTKAWRHATATYARQRIPGERFGEQKVRIVATIHKTHNRGRWDANNLADTAKACVDGLVDAGVLVDDSVRYVEGPDMRAGEPRPEAALVLVITPIEEQP